jgi:cytochrome c oxidase subunit III
MASSTNAPDIELIIEDIGGNGGGPQPPAGGDGGDDENRRRPQHRPSPMRYYIGVTLCIVSVLMFFMALAAAFLYHQGSHGHWQPVIIPRLMWYNTVVLLASSATLELARRRLSRFDYSGFRALWLLTTALGVAFVIGQVVAWSELVSQGVYLASNPASSYFYVFTGAHALHLIAGVGALLFVAWRNFDHAKVTRTVAAEIVSYFWHFLDALWLFLLAVLYLAK